VLGGQEAFGDPGDLIFKPRAQWHTFWNASDEPAVVLEIISPAGLEDLFKSFEHVTEPTPELMASMAGKYHCDLDFEATFPVIQRHGLRFRRAAAWTAARPPKSWRPCWRTPSCWATRTQSPGSSSPAACSSWGARPSYRGRGQIREAAATLCLHRPGYLAGPRRVLQVRDVALLIGRDVVNLARRSDDGTWRYDICVLLPDQEDASAPRAG
jgi:hypothetical protein